jgi:putative tricarboxylic transport membrane protein
MGGDRAASLLGLLAAGAVIAGALRLGVGTLAGPDPGFFPLLGGCALGVVSGLLLVRAGSGRSAGGPSFRITGRQALLLGAMAAYVATLELLGDVLATTGLASLSLRAFGIRSWLAIGAAGAAVALGAHLVLVRVLGVNLPAGFLAYLG